IKAASEMEGWFGKPVSLAPPRKGGRTWRLVCRLGRSESLRLHVDSQEFPSHSVHPVVIQFPSLPQFVCESPSLDELMAEKVVAVTLRRYLGGRDLFDLWFHWLREDGREKKLPAIRQFLERKIRDRSLAREDFFRRLKGRLSSETPLLRAREEWRRYLPEAFQKESVENDIIARCRELPAIMEVR
ncbi:MAG: nucleotidyl transferase AbiEii/AbiGii toxin family protein, partial [Deltaproteobacteria bacterium]|nr:nucleotidyl transferase AbiEii/AbiGii toxin family protein [Deltaproteobacteria bacterium]